jgi:hypothetical protein
VSLRFALALDYDQIVYLDSDCVFKDQDTGIDSFVERTPVQVGTTFVKCCFAFLNNTPWNENMPCSGFMIAKNCPATLSLLKKWWNFPNPGKNFDNEFEQASLHEIFVESINQLCVWDSISLFEKGGQFLRHVIEPKLREAYFTKLVDELEATAKEYSFSVVMKELKSRHFVCLKTSSIRF